MSHHPLFKGDAEMRNEIGGFGRSRRNLAKALFERHPDPEIAGINDLAPQQTPSLPEGPRRADLAPGRKETRDASPQHV
jgi:hypothetical protein